VIARVDRAIRFLTSIIDAQPFAIAVRPAPLATAALSTWQIPQLRNAIGLAAIPAGLG
jgi:hypothetical protein